MARIFVTGSADGLGQMAARLLVADGHRVVLHARNEKRAKEALAAVSGAESAVAGDLSSIAECRQIAEQVNALGAFDAVFTTPASAAESRAGSRPWAGCRTCSRSTRWRPTSSPR